MEDSSPKYVREDTGEKKKTYDGFKEQDNSKLLNNITTWMSKDNDGKSLKASGVTLDAKTKLLDFEKPANSTEPEKNRGHNHQVVINGMIQQPSKQVVMAVKRRDLSRIHQMIIRQQIRMGKYHLIFHKMYL